jgi:cyclic-di-GMP-binding protein
LTVEKSTQLKLRFKRTVGDCSGASNAPQNAPAKSSLLFLLMLKLSSYFKITLWKSKMPSFDIVSEIDSHELVNAVDQANREIDTRFDLKGSSAKYELNDKVVKITADADFQATQLRDILRVKLVKRNIDIQCLDAQKVVPSGKIVHQDVVIREGIEQSLAKQIVKLIKDAKLKVQTSIQGDKLRVTGKKRDDLQSVIQLLKNSDLEWPLQYNNFRD